MTLGNQLSVSRNPLTHILLGMLKDEGIHFQLRAAILPFNHTQHPQGISVAVTSVHEASPAYVGPQIW